MWTSWKLKRLSGAGIDRNAILRQCLITPSCGLGSLATEQAEAILKLTSAMSDKMQKKIHP